MELRTKINIESPIYPINYKDKMMMLGSCFAQTIGEMFIQNNFDCLVNPFGILYNPISIFNILQLIQKNSFDTNKYLFYHNGHWGSWLHSTAFCSQTKEKCLILVKESFQKAVQQLQNLNTLVLTFGTNHCYLEKKYGFVVSNCHKVPASNFEEKIYSIEELIPIGIATFNQLFVNIPNLHILLTVSPYRYLKYGIHKSRLAKSTLLLCIDKWQKCFPNNISYFPSYEIMEDELRDYRFYADDMIHPSTLACQYIWEKLVQNFMDAETQRFITQWLKIQKGLNHHPIDTKSKSYLSFLEKLLTDMIQFNNKYPNLAVQTEIRDTKTKIQKVQCNFA